MRMSLNYVLPNIAKVRIAVHDLIPLHLLAPGQSASVGQVSGRLRSRFTVLRSLAFVAGDRRNGAERKSLHYSTGGSEAVLQSR